MDGELTPIEKIALQAILHMPDSIEKRMEILEAAVESIPNEQSEIRSAAHFILRHLEEHQKMIRKLQPELPLAHI
jgi:hypothetical protein